MGDVEYLPGTARYLASSLYEQGRYDDAEAIVADALASMNTDDPIPHAMCGLVAAKVLARRGEFDEAERLALGGASKRLGGFDARNRGEALLAHGEVLELSGKPEQAAEAFREALTLYEDRNGGSFSPSRPGRGSGSSWRT